jgi:DNA-binding NtrC family response regulator
VQRVGALRPRAIDVRFIAATNRDLEAEVAAGRFRRDLFYRLNGASLAIPPLRERVGEIEGLARAFVAHTCEQLGLARRPGIGVEALAALERYSWPGNIRELRNVMERAVLLCSDDAIGIEHLPTEKMGSTLPASRRAEAPGALGERPAGELRDDIEALTRQRIADALSRCGGNQTHAARLLGISRPTLNARMDQYGLPRPRKRTS